MWFWINRISSASQQKPFSVTFSDKFVHIGIRHIIYLILRELKDADASVLDRNVGTDSVISACVWTSQQGYTSSFQW